MYAKGHERNNPMLKSMKEKEKIAHTFKGNYQKEGVMFKGVQNI